MIPERKSVGIIIQARLNSTRLPNKVILPLIRNKTVLDMVIDKASRIALQLVNYHDTKIVVAMPDTEPKDIERLLPKTISMPWGLDENGRPAIRTSDDMLYTFYGSENDLFDRYHNCAADFGFDYVYRFTADDPFRNPNLGLKCINKLIEGPYDYVCTNNQPYGMNHECFTSQLLKDGWNNAIGPEREHMSLFFRRKTGFKSFTLDRNEPDLSKFIATIDVPEDIWFWRRFLND